MFLLECMEASLCHLQEPDLTCFWEIRPVCSLGNSWVEVRVWIILLIWLCFFWCGVAFLVIFIARGFLAFSMMVFVAATYFCELYFFFSHVSNSTIIVIPFSIIMTFQCFVSCIADIFLWDFIYLRLGQKFLFCSLV